MFKFTRCKDCKSSIVHVKYTYKRLLFYTYDRNTLEVSNEESIIANISDNDLNLTFMTKISNSGKSPKYFTFKLGANKKIYVKSGDLWPHFFIFEKENNMEDISLEKFSINGYYVDMSVKIEDFKDKIVISKRYSESSGNDEYVTYYSYDFGTEGFVKDKPGEIPNIWREIELKKKEHII